MSELVTGEAVALDLSLAALPSRAVGRSIDLLAQLVAFFVVSVLVGAIGDGLSDAAYGALAIVTLVLVVVGYPVAFETLTRGRTPGKMAMGLRVVRDDGGPITFRQAFVRGLTGMVELVTLFVASVVVMLLSPRSKRLGDLVAGTVVVQERVSVKAGPVAHMPPPLAAWATTLELSRLSDELALSARQFVSRAATLNPSAREDLGGRLVSAVAAVTAPPPPPGTPGWAFLAAVLAERRRRETERLAAGAPATSFGATQPAAYRPSYVPPPPSEPAPAYGHPTPAPLPRPTSGFAPPA